MEFSPLVPLALVCGCLYYALSHGLPRALAAFDQQVCCRGGGGWWWLRRRVLACCQGWSPLLWRQSGVALAPRRRCCSRPAAPPPAADRAPASCAQAALRELAAPLAVALLALALVVKNGRYLVNRPQLCPHLANTLA
jgi:hypothetical protein